MNKLSSIALWISLGLVVAGGLTMPAAVHAEEGEESEGDEDVGGEDGGNGHYWQDCLRTQLHQEAMKAGLIKPAGRLQGGRTLLPGVVRDPNTGRIRGVVTSEGLFLQVEHDPALGPDAVPKRVFIPERLIAFCGGGGSSGGGDSTGGAMSREEAAKIPVQTENPTTLEKVEVTGKKAEQPQTWIDMTAPTFEQMTRTGWEPGSGSTVPSTQEQKEEHCKSAERTCKTAATGVAVTGAMRCVQKREKWIEAIPRFGKLFALIAEATCMVGVESGKQKAEKWCEARKDECLKGE